MSNPFNEEDPFADPVIANALKDHSDPQFEDSSSTHYGERLVDNSASTPQETELQRREAELAAREASLTRQEQTLREQAHNIQKPPNFPPLYPIMFHDIDVEIPPDHREVVRRIYWIWLATVGTLIWNAVAAFLILVSHASGVVTGATDFGGAFVYCFTISAASFFLWYRPVYNAYMKDKALYFCKPRLINNTDCYFVFGGLHIAFQYYMAVGIPGSGSAGLINTISMLSDNKIVAGMFGLVNSVLWAMEGTAGLWLYRQVHAHYLSMGHSFAEARGQALKTVAQV